MKLIIVKDGQDPFTKAATDYLAGLGVPAALIRKIEINSEVGDVLTLRVTLIVDLDAVT